VTLEVSVGCKCRLCCNEGLVDILKDIVDLVAVYDLCVVRMDHVIRHAAQCGIEVNKELLEGF